MGFDKGKVTFTRFDVRGQAPDTGTLVQQLQQGSFRKTENGQPPEREVGWISGAHLYDTAITADKVIYDSREHAYALFAMRIDTNKAPASLKRAYKDMELQRLAEDNPSGLPSRAQKKEAAETAERQVAEEVAAGKHRRSKMVPIFWDRNGGVLYFGSTSGKDAEALQYLARESLGIQLTPLTAGSLAERLAPGGMSMDDTRPVDWVESVRDVDEAPFDGPPWLASAMHPGDHIGNEMLLWLCARDENPGSGILPVRGSELSYAVNGRLSLSCAHGLAGQHTIGDETPMRRPEARLALREGKWPRSAGLILADSSHQWEFVLGAESMAVTSAALPPVNEAEGPRDAVLQRLRSVVGLAQWIDGMLELYLHKRRHQQVTGELGSWLGEGGGS